MRQSRNSTIGFATRTRKNLLKVMRDFNEGEDFHIITHLVNSLLGIVVVPNERFRETELLSLSLEEIYRDGWPKWDILLDDPKDKQEKTETLGVLVSHLRNATAHGRFTFTGDSESRNLEEVWLVVEDRPRKKAKTNWRAMIRGTELLSFCLNLCDLMEGPSDQHHPPIDEHECESGPRF